jgi:hypothetical protein
MKGISMRRSSTIAAAVIVGMGLMVPQALAQGSLTPTAYQTIQDSNGIPIVGACIWTYLAGTSTPTATYTAKLATVPNTNPIITDSAGQFVAYLLPGQSYKFVFETACAPPAHGAVLRTQDGIDATLGTFSAAVVGDESVTIRNTTPGVANRAVLFVGNDTSATLGTLAAHSSTFTTLGAAIANGVKLTSSGVGGLSLQASDATGIIHFFTGTGTVERGQITAAGLWNWTAFGAHQFAASGTGGNSLAVSNTTAGTGNFSRLQALSDTVTTSLVSTSSTYTPGGSTLQAATELLGNGVGGISITASQAAGAIRLYTGGSVVARATFDAAGNFNLGSTNLMDSPAVPTLTSVTGGTATIAGRDTGFVVTEATGTITSFSVNFNTTYAFAPACVASPNFGGGTITAVQSAVGGVVITLSPGTGGAISVICRGF